MIKKILFVVLLLCWEILPAQQPVLYFKRLTRDNGLSNNKVNCILQDKRGFTWIGTDDGLNRYDGNNFLSFKNIPGQSSSVSGNSITDLHEDKDGILWIATADGGISRYDYRLPPEKQFRQYKHQPGDSSSIPVNIINALQEDRYGNLWLATSGAAVLRFDKKKESFLFPKGMGAWTIFDISLDHEGILWAGRQGGSILKVNTSTLSFQVDPRYSNLYPSKPQPHVVVTSLFQDSKKNTWFGSWDKAVYRYNAATNSEESFQHEAANSFSFGVDEPLAFNEDKKGRIWIGGKDFGLYIYDPSNGRFYNYRHNSALEGTLSHNTVNQIFIDSSGMVWVATNNGVSIYHSEQHHFEQQFLTRMPGSDEPVVIYDFYKEKSGPLWIGTSKGIYIQELNGSIKMRSPSYMGTPLSVTRFYKDDNADFYIGTDYSLFKYNRETNQVIALPGTDKDPVMAKLIESRIVSIVKDTINGHPVMWTAPYGHFISYYDFTAKTWVSRSDTVKKLLSQYKIKDNLVRKIVKTKDGKVWLGNAKNGLTLLDKNQKGSNSFINNPTQKGSISNNNVYDIKEDQQGNLWISTYGGGLNYFDTRFRQFAHYPSVSNLLEGMEIDNQGNIWSISNGSLQKFDPHTSIFTYAELPDIEKSGGVKGYIYKDQDGKMYVAGTGYFISFNPDEVVVHRKQPEVFLTDLTIFDESYAHLLTNREIALGHTENFFTLHFAAPHYIGSAPVYYSYMLQGVDKDWINAGTSTQAPYTDLSGGEYTFRVRATSTPGSWSDTITTIRIRIIPPFWKRWWFFCLVALALATIAWGLYRYRINELLKRQAIRNKIAQDLHDNVGSTLSSISVYSQVAKIYKQKGRQEDLQHTLEKISTTSGEMISEMNDIVWAINPRNDNMQTILQRMESYAKPLLNTQGILSIFEFDEDLPNLNLQMETRKNFYLIFKEAINNSIKYANCKNLSVKVSRHQQQITLLVQDDGKGFDPGKIDEVAAASLSGNGLRNMRIRAKEMKGILKILSAPGEGVRVELVFQAH